MRRLLAVIDQPSSPERQVRHYLIAIALSCAAGAITAILIRYTVFSLPFLFGLGAVVLSAGVGGAGPALLAGGLTLTFGFLAARGLPPIDTDNLVAIAVFVATVSGAGELLVQARRQASRQLLRLARSETYLQSIFHTLPAAMLVTDLSGEIIALNTTARIMFAIDPSRDGPFFLHGLIALSDAPTADGSTMMDRLLADANSLISAAGIPADGVSQLHLMVAAAPLDPADPWLVTVYLRDETAMRRAAESVAELQASVAQLGRASALGAMGSAIAHELNQPLASAANYAAAARSHLTRQSHPPPQALVALEATIGQVIRAGEILKGLRTFVRAAPVRPQWLHVHDVIQEARQLGHFVLNDMRVTLTTEIHEDVSHVWSDRVQIQQVLVNLLNNAAEAVANQKNRNVCVSARLLPDDMAEICVSDTGGGISPDMRKRLFQPFNTSKGLGLGVGLAISKTIVEAHGGTIWYEDHGEGARFCLTLKHGDTRTGGDQSG